MERVQTHSINMGNKKENKTNKTTKTKSKQMITPSILVFYSPAEYISVICF